MPHIAHTWQESLLDGTEGRAVVFRKASRRERSTRVWQAIQCRALLFCALYDQQRRPEEMAYEERCGEDC